MIKKKKPMAARGKTTKKGKIVKALKSVFKGVKPKVSPKTKAQRMQALMKKMKTTSPGMKKAITGSAVGMGGAGLMAMARKLKPTGRINAADLERVKKMMGKRNGGKLMTKKDAQTKADRLNSRFPLKRARNFEVVDTGQKGKGILSKLPVQASGTRFTIKAEPIKGIGKRKRPERGFRRKK